VAEVVDSDNVRVTELRERLGLACEPLGKCRVHGDLRWQDLECDKPVELPLARLVHRPHAALAEQFQNLKLRKVVRQRRWLRRDESTGRCEGGGRCRSGRGVGLGRRCPCFRSGGLSLGTCVGLDRLLARGASMTCRHTIEARL